MDRTITAPVPDDRSPVERLQTWRLTASGQFAWWCIEVGVVAGLYYGAARAGLHLAYLHGSVTALWPPVGVGVAALVILGPGIWPGIVIGDLLVADFSSPWGTVLGQTLGNTLEVVVAAILFRRLAGRRTGLERVWDVLALVACAAIGTLISAAFGVVSLRLGHVIKAAEFGSVFRTWWLADFSGALVLAPLVLVWATRRSWRMPRIQIAEAVLLLAILVVLIEVPSQRDVPYIVFPILIWAALRFGSAGAATALAIVSSLTVWNTAHGSGPFVRTSLTHSLLASQLFVAVAALTSLVLALVVCAAIGTLISAAFGVVSLRLGHVIKAAEFGSVFRTWWLADFSGALVLMVTFVGGWSESGTLAFPVDSRVALEGTGVLAAVRESGEPQRIDRYEGRTGELVERFTSFGYGSATAAPVKLGAQVWGALVAAGRRGAPLSAGSESRLRDFADLVAQALANADAYRKLAASRARIVEAADIERQRLERNLHDGAQQRLVSLALKLRLVKASLRRDPTSAEAHLTEAEGELGQALDELRELARGIHPAVLTDRGLTVALEALAERASLPVELTRVPEDRLPDSIEAAIYYLVAEAITNVAKYAQATQASVAVERSNGIATVVVSDDGVGGAEPNSGSGLVGLADRVEALGGRLRVDSPPGRGTRITAEIPCA
ncbi:MAG: GAF domain-containing protein [Actinobacteria bacterium]|nr:MAG: GAF domain-containing protein [Actinomycetota bacterium]